MFDVWWNKLEIKLNSTPKHKIEKKDTRTDRDILNEILINTRKQLRKEEIRLNSMRDKDDGISDVIKNLKSNFNSFSNPKSISDLLNDNNIELLKQPNPLTGLNIPFDKLIKILDEQKNITNELLENKEINKIIERTKKSIDK